jgi:hypothetical protein
MGLQGKKEKKRYRYYIRVIYRVKGDRIIGLRTIGVKDDRG